MIIGLGTDITGISRIKKAIDKGGESFLKKVYTPQEISSYTKRNCSAVSYLAGRWAAKEALAKALGCGIGENCSLTDIDVAELASGAPALVLSGNAKKYADFLGVNNIFVSISHEDDYAVATVVLEK